MLNLTQTITSWSELPSLNRGVYSVLIGIAIYGAFRYLIYLANKSAPKGHKERGNYWEGLRAKNEPIS